MKPQTFFLGSQVERARAAAAVADSEINGATKVVITDTRGKSARCRGLQWTWNKEVAKSGIGSRDDARKVHRDAKWRWAVPILRRDNEDFAKLWAAIEEKYLDDPDAMKFAVDNWVSTEGEDFAIGEYMTDFKRFWSREGVNLTTPDKGLLDYMEGRE